MQKLQGRFEHTPRAAHASVKNVKSVFLVLDFRGCVRRARSLSDVPSCVVGCLLFLCLVELPLPDFVAQRPVLDKVGLRERVACQRTAAPQLFQALVNDSLVKNVSVG